MIMIGVDNDTDDEPGDAAHDSGVDIDDCKIFSVDDYDNSDVNDDDVS